MYFVRTQFLIGLPVMRLTEPRRDGCAEQHQKKQLRMVVAPWMRTDQGGDARQNPRQRHQHLYGSVRRCVRGVLAQRTRRPVFLNTTRSSFLPSNSPAFSLAVHTQPSPPLPCARPPATKGSWSSLSARVSCPVGRPGGCSSCGRRAWRSRVGRASRERRQSKDQSVIEMESVCRHCSLSQPF